MSLRRSQRGRRPTYNVGDVVEIIHSAGISTAQLLHKVAGSKADNVRWLVTFDEDDRLDEEVSEKSFGRLVQSAAEEQSVSSSRGSGRRSAGGRGGRKSVADSGSTGSGSSDLENHATLNRRPPTVGGRRDRKRVASAVAKDDDDEEDLPTAGSGRGRRGLPQAQRVVASGPKKPVAAIEHGRKRRRGDGETRITTRSRARREGVPAADVDVNDVVRTKKAKALGNGRGRRGGKRPSRKDKNEVVVKVEMLTGTLYLYRGENPRAEFIRYF